MKLLVFLFFFFHFNLANAEKPSFKFVIGSNINSFPIQFNKSNKDIKIPLSIKFNDWTLSPGTSSFVKNKSKMDLKQKKYSADIFF